MSAATVRRTRCAILWAASLSVVACGDDGGSSPGPNEQDAGKESDAGKGDAGKGFTDAELAALDRTGVKVSTARADIVFPLACKNGVACDMMSTVASCMSESRGSYDEKVSQGVNDACLDATLDFWSCFAETACAQFDSKCGPLYDTQVSLCPIVADAGK
jgi:hypothetical protein